MKKTSYIIPALALALALFLACPLAQAQTVEPQNTQKLESLHDQLWAKQMELEALVQAGNAKEVKAATDEVIKLRTQVRDERRRLGGPDQGSPAFGPGYGRGWGKGGGRNPDCPYYKGGGRGPGWGHGGRGCCGW